MYLKPNLKAKCPNIQQGERFMSELTIWDGILAVLILTVMEEFINLLAFINRKAREYREEE